MQWLFFTAGGAQASTLYSEAVGGDLPDGAFPLLGTLGVGDYTVSGNTSYDSQSGVLDIDQFRIDLQSGLMATLFITVDAFSTLSGASTLNLFYNSNLPSTVGTIPSYYAGHGPNEITTFSGSAIFQSVLSSTVDLATQKTSNIDYTYTFEVRDLSVVPLPASLPLLAAGVGGLALLRRRRKA